MSPSPPRRLAPLWACLLSAAPPLNAMALNLTCHPSLSIGRGGLSRWRGVREVLLALTLVGLCGVCLPALAAEVTPSDIRLRLIGHQDVPTGTRFQNTEVGGLSGIDRLPDGRFVAISDDRGQPESGRGQPRFYTLALDYDESAFHGLRILAQTPLRQADGREFEAADSVDPEDIRLLPGGTLVWASEGVWHDDPARRHAPFVREMRLDGSPVRDFELPALFDLVDNRTRGGRDNKLFEALAITPGGTLFAANEDALFPDGPMATAERGSWLRLVAFDLVSGRAGAQYAYPLPPIPGGRPGQAPEEGDSGLVAMLALDEQRLLGLERSWVRGVGNTIRLVELRITSQTTDVRHLPALAGASFQPLERRLLLEMPPNWQGLRMDNVEGMAWGHRLANGQRSLVLMSDNNFRSLQTTQFIVLSFDGPEPAPKGTSPVVRFATFNASLNRDASGELLADLGLGVASLPLNLPDPVVRRVQQARNVAEVLQRIRADVLLINEFDLDLDGSPGASDTPLPATYASQAAQRFQQHFLARPQGHLSRGFTQPLDYPWRHTPNTNTGLPSGLDLDRSGQVVSIPGARGYGNDALGFGQFPGQYGMTVYSRFPIVAARSFQAFRWADMPGSLLLNDPSAGERNLATYYSPEARARLRLSSKNHVDLTLCVHGQPVHFLVAHPTPPAFDGPEGRNVKRNHDEIRLWADYLSGAPYLMDDAGRRGGLPAGAHFVIAGDLNADPFDGSSYERMVDGRPVRAIHQLLDHPLVNSRHVPVAPGGVDAQDHPSNNGDANRRHRGEPSHDTADFSDVNPGNLRVDYVLPSATLLPLGGGVFWPADPDRRAPNTTGHVFDLVGTFKDVDLFAGFPSSDHRAVWLDLRMPPPSAAAGRCEAPPRP